MVSSSLQKSLEEVLSQSHLKKFLPYYEERHEQREMAKTVLQAFSSNTVSLIESGTGTGKSLSYLLPSLLWSLETGERIIISTHTIALQEQLITKEIPLALKIMECDIPVSLAKGMGNYLCELKLNDATQQATLFNEPKQELFLTIHDWSKNELKPVTKSRIPLKILSHEWQEINAQPESCISSRCPSFHSCHFFKARKELQDSKIIVVNHHLLLHDLQKRVENNNWEGTSVLPPYRRVIIDEAHHLEDVALDLFSSKTHRFEHLHLIKIFLKEIEAQPQSTTNPTTNSQGSSLFKLLKIIHEESYLFTADWKAKVIHAFEFDISQNARNMAKTSEALFEALFHYSRDQYIKNSNNENLSRPPESSSMYREGGRWRIRPEEAEKASFQKIVSKFQDHEKAAKEFDAAWVGFLSLLKEGGLLGSNAQLLDDFKSAHSQKSTSLYDTLKSILNDVKNSKEKLDKQVQDIQLFLQSLQDLMKVCWVEWKYTQQGAIDISLIVASFDVGPLLRRNLFDPLASTVLLSATLAAKNDFEFAKHRLGLTFFEKDTGSKLLEAMYPSPFPYKDNALLAIIEDMPFPESRSYNEALSETIFSISKASQGGVLVLFTSYGLLETTYHAISDRLNEIGLRVMKQGDSSRIKLLQEFQKTTSSVLFATDSFWEGVDIPGDALRCVIITKLPFEVPSEPLYQARSEAMVKEGLSPFYHYALPKAVVKFK